MKQSWSGKNVLILGLGQFPKGSGISAALYALKMGAHLRVTDKKSAKDLEANVKRLKKFRGIEYIFGEHREQDIIWADIIIRNPGIRNSSPELALARRLGKQIESDISLFLAACPALTVGITGTRGKSTTTTLVYEMLQAHGKRRAWLGGNILVSPLTFIDKVKPDDVVVLELSSWLLETTGEVGLSPQIACITNLMRDHLNTYDSMEAYGEAKAQIFRHQGPEGIAVLNADDAFCRERIEEVPGTVKTFSAKKKKAVSAWLTPEALWIKQGNEDVELISRKKLRVFGEHNAMNLLAAALVAQAAGASLKSIRSVMANFSGIPDRQEILQSIRGVTYINDTTATTPDGVIAALRAIPPRFAHSYFIMGGNDKELEFEDFAKQVKKTKPTILLLPGNASDKMAALFELKKIPYTLVDNLTEAVQAASQMAKKGDAVVLSPGGTSFGQFKNEFDRGNQFRALVKKLDRKA